jgi:putative heme-binding domain-containing protein
LQLHWKPSSDGQEWQGWIPHIDLEVAKNFTQGSAKHDALWPKLQTAGTLTIRGQLDLWQMLQPAIQPGATLDYDRPREEVKVVFTASPPFELRFAGKTLSSAKASDGYQSILQHRSQTEWLSFEISMQTSTSAPRLTAAWSTGDDSRLRAFPLRRLLMPWAKPDLTPSDSAPVLPKELAGGNWPRGKRLFFGEVATCYKCHSVRGEGNNVGPDLSNLVHRDYASVLKDIRFPNAALNPDHLSYIIHLTDGEELTAVLQGNTAGAITVADASGRKTISRTEVKSIQPTATSLMPEGLDKALGDGQLKDLLTFLLVPPLEPAPIHIPDAPPARTRSEVNAFLNISSETNARPMRVLLCAGPKDHGTDEHDYPLWLERWARLLALDESVTVSTNSGWPSSDMIRQSDVIVFYSNNPGWTAAKASELDDFQKRGGGLVYIHFAVDGHDATAELSERIGLAWRGGQSKFRHGQLDMELPLNHSITRGLSHLNLHDESYWDLTGDPGAVQVLATNVEDGKPRPLLWTYQRGEGRVFVSIPGHYTWTFDDPLFRAVLLRGICWAAHQPENRLDHLAPTGARISDPTAPPLTARQR